MYRPAIRFPASLGPCLLVVLSITAGRWAGAEELLPWQRASYDPPWSEAAPLRTVDIAYDVALSPTGNGARLVETLAKLQPGDCARIAPGQYVVTAKLTLDLKGTAAAPIWIVGWDPARPPVISRPDASQNLLNLGERRPCRYLALRHLELTGGSVAIRFYDCAHVWLDRCELHHAEHGGITVNSRDTDHLYVTRNHLHHFLSGTGEAMYLGANHGNVVMHHSVIAANHVHDCGGEQGDGIELKQGSYANWLVENHIHDTKYPCLITYGTQGKGINVVERNLCYRSGDNTMQIQGEAIVRNNLIMAAGGAGFASTDHQGQTRDLQFVHNTVITAGRGANLNSWNAREGMVFANNAVYSQRGPAVRFPNGASGVTCAGNVVWGNVEGIRTGFVRGRGLDDFRHVTWDAAHRDAAPGDASALLDAAVAAVASTHDLSGRSRANTLVAGAILPGEHP